MSTENKNKYKKKGKRTNEKDKRMAQLEEEIARLEEENKVLSRDSVEYENRLRALFCDATTPYDGEKFPIFGPTLKSDEECTVPLVKSNENLEDALCPENATRPRNSKKPVPSRGSKGGKQSKSKKR
ncbi:hypothetical protein KM043_002931 [Ampulex compressa]|nr:hypothetical protein KM043_002931 [Ampulex compressa]